MKFKAHKYQGRAIRWVEDHPRCLLFLDMGLGKSVITLTAIQHLIDHAEVEKVLVVAPKKVAESTWGSEAAKWDHLDLRISLVMGDEKKRVAALATDADIYVTSRDMVVWLTGYLGKGFDFDMVVIDELTSFKNPASQRFKHIKRVLPKASRVVGLTGTPTPNGLIDLWAQVYCIDGGKRLGQFVTRFRSEYFDVVEHNHIVIKCWAKKGSEEKIMGLISDIALTMRAEDWLELPELIEHDIRVSLDEKTMEGYREFQREKILELKKEGTEVAAPSAAALANKLSQYANGAVYDEDRGVHEIHNEKIKTLEEIMESVESPVLCFYQYQHDRDRIMAALKGYNPRAYQGNEELEDWNSGKIRLLLAHPASTAFGLNMQGGGHTIVWFSTGWNLELYQQANARLHRQGQRHPVIVHRLIASGTIDERMVAAITGKGMSQAQFLSGLKSLMN